MGRTEQRPLRLGDLSGGVLVWTDRDGNEHRVKFDEY